MKTLKLPEQDQDRKGFYTDTSLVFQVFKYALNDATNDLQT